ncbi:MAG: hypothetical protein L3J16_08020, partial [Anaerolineales bacterium]|nr:hypothetical protein [Anaerolineales bacterium]
DIVSPEPDFMPPQAAKAERKTSPRRKEKQPFTTREKMLRSLWTLTSEISRTVNIGVVIVLALVFMYFPRGYKLPDGIGPKTLTNLLQGLYENFELMDAAHITTSIQLQDEIPVQFDLELKQPTNVIFGGDVVISGAYVVINTAVIDISAPAVVTLPAGTNLPILLDLSVPVDTTVPVDLTVNVNIPLEETDLHTPFVGLQNVVRPLYCLVEPKAASIITQEGICPQ